MRPINANALKAKLRERLQNYEYRPDDFGIGRCAGMTEAMEIVDAAPTISATSAAHGYWVERRVVHTEDTAIDAWQSAKCSNCGKYHTTPYLYYFTDYAYCPNCGVRKSGKQEDEGANN